jgi:hypothetical protein
MYDIGLAAIVNFVANELMILNIFYTGVEEICCTTSMRKVEGAPEPSTNAVLHGLLLELRWTKSFTRFACDLEGSRAKDCAKIALCARARASRTPCSNSSNYHAVTRVTNRPHCTQAAM